MDDFYSCSLAPDGLRHRRQNRQDSETSSSPDPEVPMRSESVESGIEHVEDTTARGTVEVKEGRSSTDVDLHLNLHYNYGNFM